MRSIFSFFIQLSQKSYYKLRMLIMRDLFIRFDLLVYSFVIDSVNFFLWNYAFFQVYFIKCVSFDVKCGQNSLFHLELNIFIINFNFFKLVLYIGFEQNVHLFDCWNICLINSIAFHCIHLWLCFSSTKSVCKFHFLFKITWVFEKIRWSWGIIFS